MQVIRWLEDYLTSKDVSAVVVTHDRAFMESVCTSVLELEHGEVHLHDFGGPGSYERFREVRSQHPFSSDCCWAQHCMIKESMLPHPHYHARLVHAAQGLEYYFILHVILRAAAGGTLLERWLCCGTVGCRLISCRRWSTELHNRKEGCRSQLWMSTKSWRRRQG